MGARCAGITTGEQTLTTDLLPLLGMAIGLTLHRIRRKHAGASADPKAAERRSAP